MRERVGTVEERVGRVVKEEAKRVLVVWGVAAAVAAGVNAVVAKAAVVVAKAAVAKAAVAKAAVAVA